MNIYIIYINSKFFERTTDKLVVESWLQKGASIIMLKFPQNYYGSATDFNTDLQIFEIKTLSDLIEIH